MQPNYTIEFLDTERGVAFRMLNKSGRHRSKIITIGVTEIRGLEKAYTEWKLYWSDFPKENYLVSSLSQFLLRSLS